MAEPEHAKEVEFAIPPFFYLYKDGSVSRSELRPPLLPSSDPHEAVSCKELTLNAELGLWARIYLPNSPSTLSSKLPLVLFFHGGGFILGSPAMSHAFCTLLAQRSSSIWVSASYRLAPEHRLPAAFDDCFSAWQWLHGQALLQSEGKEEQMEPWLRRADFGRCFVAGVSAGGSIAHRVAVQALNEPWSPDAWEPLRIRGLIPIHAGFGRQGKTREEEESPPDLLMSWDIADRCISLAMLEGLNDRDHPYINPLPELASGKVCRLPPRALVANAERDLLRFMGEEYAQALQKAGCSVEVLMSRGVGHTFFMLQPHSEEAELLYQKVASFICED